MTPGRAITANATVRQVIERMGDLGVDGAENGTSVLDATAVDE